jgi:hypothetical protein
MHILHEDMKCDRKLFNSIGPHERYREVALLCFYHPVYWRKVSRMLNNLRRKNHPFDASNHLRLTQYANSAFKDTKLPDVLRFALRHAIEEEFNLLINA